MKVLDMFDDSNSRWDRNLSERDAEKSDSEIKKSENPVASDNDSVAQDQYFDPELQRAISYAQSHYPSYKDPQIAFDKWVQRSISHSEERDLEHDEEIENLYRKLDQVATDLNKLKQQGVAEGSEVQKTFKVVYHSPKTDRNVTKMIKASNESEIWDKLHLKGIQVISVTEQGVAEGSILKSIKRGLQGWGTGDAPTPKELVRQNKGYSDDDIKALARDTRNINPHTPGGLQKRVVDREMKKRGLGEQGVAEGSEQVFKVVAVSKSNALEKPTTLNVKASSLDEVFERLAINDWYPLEINGIEVIKGKRLKQGVAEGFKNTYNVGDRVDSPLGTGTIVAVSKNINVDGRVKVKLDDPSRAGEDGRYKDSFVLDTIQLKHISEQSVAEGALDARHTPDTDQILQHLTSAFYNMRKYSDSYSNFETVERVYNFLRSSLKQGDYEDFMRRYEGALSRYPDAATELIGEMFADAGLDTRTATIEDFLDKVGTQGVAEDNEQKYRVTYDMYFTNSEKPLYTKTRTVRADSEEEAIKIIQDLIGGRNHRIEKVVAEGKFTINAKTGAKLDPRTGVELPPKEKPMTMKQMFAQPKQPKLTLDDVWLKIQSVVSNIYPDGDPIDHLAPWLKKHGIRDFKIGEILDRAAKKNGYKDLYDYWESMGDLPLSEQGVTEGVDNSFRMSTSNSNVTPELRGVSIPGNMKHPEWREPTWSFSEVAGKLGVTPKELQRLALSLGNFPKKSEGLKSSYGSKAYYPRSEIKRWVNTSGIRDIIKSKQDVVEGKDSFGYPSYTIEQLQRMFRNGTWEPMSDLKPNSHVQIRNTTTGGRKTVHVKPDNQVGLKTTAEGTMSSSNFLWSKLDPGLTVEEKIIIAEEIALRGNLKESVDEDKKEYFNVLSTMADIPTKGEKYIVIPLMLVGDRVMTLDKPTYLTFVGSARDQLIFRSSTGERRYPSNTLRDLSIANTFTFLTTEKYDKFRAALALKFSIGLPDVKLIGDSKFNSQDSKQFEAKTAKVEAWGYMYNNRDQRIVWRKVFPSGEAAYRWADLRNATVLGTRETEDSKTEPRKPLFKESTVSIKRTSTMSTSGERSQQYQLIDALGRNIAVFEDAQQAKHIYSTLQKLREALEVSNTNPTDRVTMDIPLLLRVLEFAKEDAKTDMDLHDVTENLIDLSKSGQPLSMKDYEDVVDIPNRQPAAGDEQINEVGGRYWCKKERRWKDRS